MRSKDSQKMASSGFRLLQRRPASRYTQIEALIRRGHAHRTAKMSAEMGHESSRSHCVVSVHVRQEPPGGEGPRERGGAEAGR